MYGYTGMRLVEFLAIIDGFKDLLSDILLFVILLSRYKRSIKLSDRGEISLGVTMSYSTQLLK